MKNLQSENLRLKHGSDKIDVTDSYIWSLALNYKDWKTATDEKDKERFSKLVASNHIRGLSDIYSEITMDDIVWLIKEKKANAMQTIKALTSEWVRDAEIKKAEEQKYTTTYSPFMKVR
jgi:hypothetical protein